MTERLAAIRDLLTRGYGLVRISPADKKPMDPGWTISPILTPEPFERNATCNVGIVCGGISVGLVCIDLDRIPFALASRYLPPTEMRDGRASSPDSHLWYVLTEEPWPDEILPGAGSAIRQAMEAGTVPRFPGSKRWACGKDDNGKNRLVELKASGNQVVVPPSAHPSGESREWSGGIMGEPALISYAALRSACERLRDALAPEEARQPGKPLLPAGASTPATPQMAHVPVSGNPDSALELCRQALIEHGPAIEGQGGHDHTYRAACIGGDYALSPEGFWPLLADWNLSCQPPWDAEALRQTMANAYQQRRFQPGVALIRQHLPNNDLEAARQFAAQNRWRLRYCSERSERDAWMCFDGRRWCSDMQMAQTWASDYALALMQAVLQNGNNAPKTAFPVAKRLVSAGGIHALLRLAAHAMAIRADAFDRQRYVLNVNNGVVDLRTGELRPHDPTDLCTMLAPTDYIPGAQHQAVDTVLDHLSNHDRETRECLERLLGMAATGDTSAKVIGVVIGPPDCGKGTLFEAVAAALGDYAITAQPDLFLGVDATGRATPEAAVLQGRRLAYCNETDDRARLNGAALKRLVGGNERITARPLYCSPITFEMQATLFLATNFPPSANDRDEALFRRLLFFGPKASVPMDQRDPELKSKLRSDPAVRTATLAMVVQGARRWHAEGHDHSALRVSPQMRGDLDSYRKEQDPLADFLAECCETGVGKLVARQGIMARYADWCRESDVYARKAHEVYARLRELPGVREARVGSTRVFEGVGLLPPACSPGLAGVSLMAGVGTADAAATAGVLNNSLHEIANGLSCNNHLP